MASSGSTNLDDFRASGHVTIVCRTGAPGSRAKLGQGREFDVAIFALCYCTRTEFYSLCCHVLLNGFVGILPATQAIRHRAGVKDRAVNVQGHGLCM